MIGDDGDEDVVIRGMWSIRAKLTDANCAACITTTTITNPAPWVPC